MVALVGVVVHVVVSVAGGCGEVLSGFGTFGRIIRSKVQNLTRVFNYLHDSNSNFRLAGINSE